MTQILVIDDDPTARLILQRALQNQGYDVKLAENGVEGLVLAEQICPEVILCDWIMPQMDGLEVCRRAKANSDLSTTFFILVTARGATEDRIQGLDSGADDFLAKPIEMNELRARVRAGLRLQQLTRDLQQQKAILESALLEATNYVRSLLPPPLEEPLAIETRFIPSQQLGGDCFDYYWLDPDYLAIYLIDMSGHGLGAALPSVSVLNMLRTQSLKDVNFYQPNQVLRALNEAFQMQDQGNKYFTIWYGVYSPTKRQLFYASAGHPPALLLSGHSQDSEVRRLRTPTLPVGLFPETEYSSASYRIAEPSTLYIISDGLYEVRTPDGYIWGLDNFINLLQQHHRQGNPNLDALLSDIQTITGQNSFGDDVSLLRLYLG